MHFVARPRAARLLVAAATLVAAGGPRAAAAPRTFLIEPQASRVTVQVGKAGLFKFAGHEHEVAVPLREGRIVADPDALGRSSLSFSVRAAELRVTGRGEPAEDVPKVQEKMLGPDVLDAARVAGIAFRSTSVSGRAAGAGVYEVTVAGELSLHGVTRRVELPARVEIHGDELTARGSLALRQKDFGIQPVSAGAGTVKVKNELSIEWQVLARAAAPVE